MGKGSGIPIAVSRAAKVSVRTFEKVGGIVADDDMTNYRCLRDRNDIFICSSFSNVALVKVTKCHSIINFYV